jgi:polysaccharide export outer membrane protein
MRRRLSSSLLFPLLVGLALVWPGPARGQEEYTIGPRDVLAITVWGHADLSRDYSVSEEGLVAFPLIGRVQAAGLSTRALAARLAELLEKDYLVNPQVLVDVKDYLSRKVHVLGEAEKPGLYHLTGPTTVVEMLSKAGGVSKAAGRQLVVVRTPRSAGGPAGNVILRVDLGKIQSGDPSENIRLEDQDTLFIPKAQAFFVLGEVRAAGTFPLDKETSVFEAVTLAGGFTDRAAPSEVKLLRRTADGREETMALDLSGANTRDRMARLQEGDTILVPKGNTFFVFGEVKRPGAYQLDKDTNVLEGVTIAGGLTERAAPGRARVLRNTPAGQQVFNVDLVEIIKRGQRDRAMLLQAGDVLVVPESFF